jgi:hypothetical protein
MPPRFASLGFLTRDALQVASAVNSGCDLLYTDHKRLSRCPDIEFVFVDA